jgi:hypothetical protein
MDNTKEFLLDTIKVWLEEDNEINKLKQLIKVRTEKKKKLTQSLLLLMKTHEIDCFDIKNGSISYKKTNVKKQLNMKSLTSAINKYYENKKNNVSADEIKIMTTFIMNTRETSTRETIQHKSF